MKNSIKSLCIIPARGGSKSVSKKNLTQIGNSTLFYYAAECIKESEMINRTIVSTDSNEIADHARILGLEVPFLRPSELAGDDVTDWPVFMHSLQWLEKNEGYRPDIIVHLRVTSPFAFKRIDSSKSNFPENWAYIKREQIIDKMIPMLVENPEMDSIRTVELVRDTPYKMWKIENGILKPFIQSDIKEIYNQPRQKIPPAYLQNGYVDVTRYNTIVKKKSMNGDIIGSSILDCDYFVDIDQYSDIELGELMFQQIIMGKSGGNK